MHPTKNHVCLIAVALQMACSESPKSLPIQDCPISTEIAYPLSKRPCLAKNLTWESDIEETADVIASLGVGAVRTDFLWKKIEPQKGEWDFSHYDKVVDALEQRNIEVIPMLGYGVPWASSQTEDDSHYPPDDPADFANFAAQTAQRYENRIQRFEIWNEPNAGFRFWKPQIAGDPIAFGELVLAAEQAIHNVTPQATVILGGTFYHQQIIPGAITFLQELIEAHPTIEERIDAVAIHPYSLYPPTAAPEDNTEGQQPIWQMIANIQQLFPSLPIVVTEYGIPTTDVLNRETQAAYLERGYLLALAQGATDVCWYSLQNGEDPDNIEANFGLLNYDGSWSPTTEAFVNLGSKLSAATSVSRITSLSAGMFGVHLEGVGSAVWGDGEFCNTSLSEKVTWFP